MRRRLAYVWMVLMAGMWVGACSPNPPESASMAERQDQALQHPFDSSPGHVNTDVGGGGIGDFDQKAWNRDVDHVLNP